MTSLNLLLGPARPGFVPGLVPASVQSPAPAPKFALAPCPQPRTSNPWLAPAPVLVAVPPLPPPALPQPDSHLFPRPCRNGIQCDKMQQHALYT